MKGGYQPKGTELQGFAWSSLFDDTFDLIQVYDKDLNLQYMNPAFTHSLGLAPSDSSGYSLRCSTNDEEWALFKEQFARAVSEGKTDFFKIHISPKKERKIWVRAQLSRIEYPNTGAVFVKAAFHDITYEVHALKAQEFYFSIVESSISSQSLSSFYEAISRQLAHYFHIPHFAACSFSRLRAQKPELSFCSARVAHNELEERQKSITTILSREVIERAHAVLIYESRIRQLLEQGNYPSSSTRPVFWAGAEVPNLKSERIVLCFYTYEHDVSFNHTYLDILDFIARQLSVYVERSTQKKRIEVQDAHMLSIAESSTHQIWSIDSQYKLTFFNKHFEDALKQYFDLQTLPDGASALSPQVVSADHKVAAFWKRQYDKALAGQHINFEDKVHTHDDRVIWRDVFISPIYLSGERITEVSVIAHDITDKKQVEQALRLSEEKFRAIFESFPDIYFRFTHSGKVSLVSPSVRTLTGYEIEEIVGRNVTQLLEIGTPYEELMKILRLKGHLDNLEVSIYRKSDRRAVPFLCSLRFRSSLSSSSFIEGVARDISEVKKTNEELLRAKEAAEASLLSKRAFLANMSHEIRTPIHGMISTLALLDNSSLTSTQEKYVNIVKRSSETLLNILSDILQLSKIEAGKVNLLVRPTDIRTTFQKLLDLFYQQALEKQININIEVASSTPPFLEINETGLLQVLSNLTSNAIKFSHAKSSIEVSATLKRRSKSRHELRVEIKDNGVGIKPETQKLLFQPFYQGENSTKKKFSGTGLGLVISKQLVTLMGGRIGLRSTYEKGSTFWFTIKVKPTDQSPQPSTSLKQPIRVLRQLSISALLVDDNKVNAQVSSNLLEEAGCTVICAYSGDEAIQLLDKHSFDIILMDIQMPEKDGVQTTKEMRQMTNILPPVVAMTAYSMEEDRVRFLAQGLDHYLSKPIRPDTLYEQMSNWVEEARRQPPLSSYLDPEVLTKLSAYLSSDQLKEALYAFEEESSSLIEEAYFSLEKQDYAHLRKQMHTLKGSAGTLGLRSLQSSSEQIEEHIDKRGYDLILNQFEELLIKFNTFKRNYRKSINEITKKTSKTIA